MTSLKINEIYYSIQGESAFSGQPCVFIRTTGCSLRCRWCDTDYAFYAGEVRSVEDILQAVQQYACPLVEVTGGEPLDQTGVWELLKKLCDAGYTVLLETGGHRPIIDIDPRVHCIVDVKCPSSAMVKKNLFENLTHVSRKDEVKFVIGDRNDYLWGLGVMQQYRLEEITNVLFSPVYGMLDPKQLAQWILEDHLKVRLQTQLHKIIWGPEARGV